MNKPRTIVFENETWVVFSVFSKKLKKPVFSMKDKVSKSVLNAVAFDVETAISYAKKYV